MSNLKSYVVAPLARRHLLASLLLSLSLFSASAAPAGGEEQDGGVAEAISLLAAAPSVTRGPYLQLGTSSSLIIRWRTDVATDSVVRYGTTAASLTSTATVSALVTEHLVTLTGLTPDTAYYYSVGTSAATLASGADYLFYTPPLPGTVQPVRIWVLGDSGTANTDAQAVRNAYYSFAGTRYTDLLLMLGDNAYDTGTDPNYQAAVFNMYPSMLRQTVLWSTIGNHDTAQLTNPSLDIPYFNIFTFPINGEAGGIASGTEKYYSFNFGNIHFVCLDSMTSSRAVNSTMLTWLKSDLAANNKAWLVAFWHHPPYTKGSHNSDTETQLIEMRANALPILEDYGVDLVLCGHSHSYERSYLLDRHYGLSSTLTSANKINGGSGREDGATGAYHKASTGPAPHQGAVYAVAGSSGKISGGTLNHPAMFISLNVLGSMVLDIDGDRLDAKFLNNLGGVQDYFTITKGTVTPNSPPSVALTAPAAGTTFVAPAEVTLTATASDSDGTVAQVEFYANGGLIGADTSEPFSFIWSGAAAGSYNLTAKATDNLGGTTTSSAIPITINPPPPTAPATLSATTASSSQINLTWTDSNNEQGFAIERSTDGTSFSQIATVGANVTSYASTGLSPNTLYYYQVRAYNTGGSSYSPVASATTLPAPEVPPSAPSNLAAIGFSKSQINLTWTDTSSNATGFKIERAQGKGAFVEIAVVGQTTVYSNTGLTPGTSYSYKVRAYNATGNSAYSNTASARTKPK